MIPNIATYLANTDIVGLMLINQTMLISKMGQKAVESNLKAIQNMDLPRHYIGWNNISMY